MKVDYHFHPNIASRRHIKRRLAAVWKAMDKHAIGAVVCTEHVFKDAPRAYREMIKAKPAHVKTHVFPGAECITSNGKGIDVIVFGMDDWYDRHPRLLKPFGMTLLEMLVYLESSELFYYIPHPYLIKTPLKKLYKEDSKMQAFLKTVSAVEAFNGCFLPLEQLCDTFGIRRVTGKIKRNLRSSANPHPKRIAETASYKFLAVGSDAHHHTDIGFSVEVACSHPSSRAETFACLTNNRDVTTIHQPKQRFTLVRLLAVGIITMHESHLKRKIHKKDNPERKILRRIRRMPPKAARMLMRPKKIARSAR